MVRSTLFAIISIAMLTGCNSDGSKGVLNGGTDKVSIGSYDNFPTAVCTTNDKGQFIIPNGTQGEVVKWHKMYTEGISNPFASMDMQAPSEVKISNGPLKGKTCSVAHAYITLQ